MRRAAVVLGVAWLAGCASILGLDGPDLEIALFAREEIAEGLRLRVNVDGSVVELDRPERRDVEAPGTGQRPVSVTLLTETGEVLATDSFDMDFRRDWEHWIHARVERSRPLGHCIGTLAVHPLAGLPLDTLFLLHGGIARDVVC